MKAMRNLMVLVLAAMFAVVPCLSLADGNYDAGAMTAAVASVAYQYGNEINVNISFDGIIPDQPSRRESSAADLLRKSELSLSFYDDYGTGRIHGVFTLDGVEVLEGTVFLGQDGSAQITTNLTGDTVMTLPAGTLGKTTNFQDFFYSSIMRRKTDIDLAEMTPMERLQATTSDMLVLFFNHLLGWTSYTQMEREGEFYVFDETFFDETETRDHVSQRMIGTVYASEFTELMWNYAATADAEMGDFQQALADVLAEIGVTGLQVHQLADFLMTQETIDPATDFVTPTHAVPADKICEKSDVSYFFKKLVKCTDRMWEECTENTLSLIVSYDSEGRMVGFDAVLPQFTEGLVTEGSLSWSLKTDEFGQERQTTHGELQITEEERIVGDAVVLSGRDIEGVCESGFTATVNVQNKNDGSVNGVDLSGDMIAELTANADGSEQEKITANASAMLRMDGESMTLADCGVEMNTTATADGTGFEAEADADLIVLQKLGVKVKVDAATAEPEDIAPAAGTALEITSMTQKDVETLTETVRNSVLGMAPKFILHPAIISDLTGLVAE